MFLYNSRDIKYKSPFGAVKTDEAITIRFPMTDTVCADGVDFVLLKDGQRTYMPICQGDGGSDNCYFFYNAAYCPMHGVLT